jgi:glucokinase
MENLISVGIDIGATKANIGLITEEGNIIDSTRLSVSGVREPDILISQICNGVEILLTKNNIEKTKIHSVGVGVPGTADIKTGHVEYCPNLGWEDIPAGSMFQKKLNMDVIVSQDSRVAAWAEYLLGAGRPYKSMFCVAIGTGIGGGIILDGKIFHGAMNTAGEIGHTIFSKHGRHCNCGLDGCLERYCSGTGIFERAFEEYPQKFADLPHKSESVFTLAYDNDKEMLRLINEVVDDLAIGIANAVSILSPEAVIISGGLCEHNTLIIEPLRQKVNKFGYHSWSRKNILQIEKAQMGSEAPMVGAALLYKAI